MCHLLILIRAQILSLFFFFFLGLLPEPEDQNELDLLDKASKIRKETQKRKEHELEALKEEQFKQLLKKEGPKMAQDMKDKVRTHWELVRLVC